MRSFVDQGEGSLAKLLDRFLGPRNSVLAETLAKQVREQSVLFKKLSPADSEGLVKALEKRIDDPFPLDISALRPRCCRRRSLSIASV